MPINFLKKRLYSFVYAIQGVAFLLRKEVNFQVQVTIAVLVTAAGFFVQITSTQWMLQVFAIGFVLSLEALNTAIEEIANFIHPDYHHKIKYIKDIAAGAVLIAAVTAVTVALIIYLPYVF